MIDILKYIDKMQEMYDGPRPMAQEPRNMYADGQLVQPNVDGSRPGYAGKQGGKKVPQQGFQKRNTYGLKNTGTFRIDEKKLNSLRKTLTNLKKGTTLNVNQLHKSTGIARKTIDNILAKEYENKFDIPGMGKAQSLNIQKINKVKEEKKTKEFNKIKKSYTKDLKQKYKFPLGSTESKNKALSNSDLAKKYFGEDNATMIGRVEKLNNKLSKELNLSYPKSDPDKYKIKRKKRLKKTADFIAGGTDDFPFHHIRQIGGEVPLTTDDIAIINKKMNSKIAPYNKPLNAIADAISDNITYSFEAMQLKQEGKALDYLKRVDELNNNAESIVKKAVKDLPKEYKNLIGFNKFYARTDEYGFPLDDKVRVEKIGGTKTTTGAIPLNDLTKDQASILRKQIKTDATAGKNINQKQILSAMEKLGCGKSAGGRIMFGNGTTCAIKGRKILERIVATGKGTKAELSMAKKILNFGKGAFSLKGLVGPQALAFEGLVAAGFVGYDVASGNPLKEAIGKNLNAILGPKWKQDVESLEFERLKGSGVDIDQLKQLSTAYKQADSLQSLYNQQYQLEMNKGNPGRFDRGNQKSRDQRLKEINMTINELNKPDGFNVLGNITETINDPNILLNKDNATDILRAQEESKSILPNLQTASIFDERRTKKAVEKMEEKFPTYTNKDIDAMLKKQNLSNPNQANKEFGYDFGMQQKQPGIGDMKYNEEVAYNDINNMMRLDDRNRYFANIDMRQEKAGGGIAGLSGGDKSGAAPTRGPNSQGLFSLRNNVKKR